MVALKKRERISPERRAKLVVAARKSLGFKQCDIAEELGTSSANLSNMLRRGASEGAEQRSPFIVKLDEWLLENVVKQVEELKPSGCLGVTSRTLRQVADILDCSGYSDAMKFRALEANLQAILEEIPRMRRQAPKRGR